MAREKSAGRANARSSEFPGARRGRLLDVLSRSADHEVRLIVAKHSDTSEAAFLNLVNIPDELVFAAVADNN